MHRMSLLLMRGLLLRCPVCGQGRLFSSWFKMNRQCPVCGLTFEREEGYFSSAMAINLVISELIIAAVAIPLAANMSIPLITVLLIGLPLPFLLPVSRAGTRWEAMLDTALPALEPGCCILEEGGEPYVMQGRALAVLRRLPAV